MKYTVLQFCDFYTATMAYWVTVLAMGGLPDQAKSLLHMVGAIGVALAIEYDRTGVFTFLVPAVVGIFVLLASWVSSVLTSFWQTSENKMACKCQLSDMRFVRMKITQFEKDNTAG